MKNQKELKHRVLEVLEGGLRGNTAARVFSITLIILILLSIVFMLILGFWTADVRFPGHPRPRWRYMTDFMTNVQMLAIMPFYLGLLLQNTRYTEFSEFFELLKLLHLLKIGEIGWHAAKKQKETEKQKRSEESEDSSLRPEG